MIFVEAQKGGEIYIYIYNIQFSRSVVYDYNPMDCITPSLPVHHQLLESTLTHVN